MPVSQIPLRPEVVSEPGGFGWFFDCGEDSWKGFVSVAVCLWHSFNKVCNLLYTREAP